MAIPTLPVWENEEIQSAGKLNQLTSAIETKFAGAIGGADLAWPLVAQGNIDMNGFSLVGLKRFWNRFNADEYTDMQAAIDAAEAAGGGCVLAPPNVVLEAEGLTMSESVLIMGHGKSSILRLPSGAASGELLATSSSPSDVGFCNLTIDGGSFGSGQNGVVLKNVNTAFFFDVNFTDFSGDALRIDNDGTGGNNCTDVTVIGCKFSGGTGDHIAGNDVDGLTISSCRFTSPGTDAIAFIPDTTSSKMRGVLIQDNKFFSVTKAVTIEGKSATPNALWRMIQVQDNQVYTASGVAITVGTTTAVIMGAFVSNNKVFDAQADAFVVLASTGRVDNNYAPSAGGDGLDMTDSQDIEVFGNGFPDATASGIDATDSDDCRVHNNDVHGFGTGEAIVKDGTTGNVWINNHGDTTSGGGTGHTQYDVTGYTTTDASGTLSPSITVPADSLKVGDIVRIVANFSASGANVRTISFSIGGADCAPLDIDNGTHNISASVDLIVTALTGAGTYTMSRAVYSLGNGDPAQEGGDAGEAIVTVDWGTDTAITVAVTQTAAETVGLDYIYLEIVGS